MEDLVDSAGLRRYYQGKKVFVTGHNGFKGGWLCAVLQLMDANVRGYSLEQQFENGIFGTINRDHSIEAVVADIRDTELLRKQIAAYKPEVLFHLAAQPLVRRSYEIPVETFDVNVTGTANVLNAVTYLDNACQVVVITTDKVYLNNEQQTLFTESDTLGGYDPYSASKACAELAVDSFRQSFFNMADMARHRKTVTTVRAGNVIGGGDWNADRLIPDIVKSLEQNQAVKIRNPKSIRPWQHVLEPIIAYLQIAKMGAEKPETLSPAYNIGPYPTDHLTVKDLVEIAIEAWGSGSYFVPESEGGFHEAKFLKLDISKAINELGWSPKLSAAEAIRWTIEWYRQPTTHLSTFTYRQIEQYLAL